jgi:hypothetical protein
MKTQRRQVMGMIIGSTGLAKIASEVENVTAISEENRPQQAQEQNLEQVAREGAQQGVEEVRAAGVDVDDQQAEAAVEGAVMGIIEDNVGEASAEQIRIIANAATRGTLSPLHVFGGQLSTDHIMTGAYGGAGGAEIAVSVATQEDRQLSAESIDASTYGAAEGSVSQAGYIAQGTGDDVNPINILGSALGGGICVLTQSSQEVDSFQVYAAAAGATGGATQSAHLRETQGQPPQIELTSSAAHGAASGSIEGATEGGAPRDPPVGSEAPVAEITPEQVYEAAFGAAVGALSQPQLIDVDQIFEFAFQSAYDALTTDEPPQPPEPPNGNDLPPEPDPEPLPPGPDEDTPFAEPITLDSFTPPIGPPEDLTGDGLFEDIDGSGEPDYVDVVKLSQLIEAYEAGLIELTEEQVAALDFNGDGILDMRDVTALDERISE